MIDLNGKISHLGTITLRGKEAVSLLKWSGQQGYFEHNETKIIINENSTDTEIAYQYYSKRTASTFCPDHRDKVKDLSCRQCLVESLKKSVDLAIDTLDPDMSRLDIIQLRESLIRRREGYGN